MNSDDDEELHRLTEMLRAIDSELASTSVMREGLQKAGIALHIAFSNGDRVEIEERYEGIGKPLSDAQKRELGDLKTSEPNKTG